jgi:AcrR family transcriptional regulator
MQRPAMARRMNKTREKILSVAKALFARQGYRKTTIRQIINESGISSGSIYNLFTNKDEIFQALMDEIMDRCVKLVDERFPNESPEFRFTAIGAIELNTIIINPVIRDIYYEAYTSIYMFEHLVERNIKLQKQLETGQSGVNNYIETLLMKGSFRSFVASLYFARKTDPVQCMETLLHNMLIFLHCEETERQRIMEKIRDNQAAWIEIGCRLL